MIIAKGIGDCPDDHVQSFGLGSAVLVVLQVDVVDQLCKGGDRPVLDLKSFHKRFERAPVPVMTELRSENIKGNGARGQPLFGGEGEPCPRIDEFPDKPRRAESVNMDVLPRCPDLLPEVRSLMVSDCGGSFRLLLGFRQGGPCLFQQQSDLAPQRVVEEVYTLNFLEGGLQLIQILVQCPPMGRREDLRRN